MHTLKVKLDNSAEKLDLLIIEEPLEIRLGFGRMDNRQQRSVSVTIRNPTHDFELTLGLMYSEDIITSYNQIMRIKYCVYAGKQATDNMICDLPIGLKSYYKI